MWIGLEVSLGLYAAMIAGIFTLQRQLMYHPLKAISTPETYGLTGAQDLTIRSADGTALQLWVHPARKDFPTLVYFHGNAIHLGDRGPKFSGFTQAGLGLVAVSYRGFGKSQGSPSEVGIYADARASIAYAREVLGVAQDKLIYFGESLGSGVAVQMASEKAPGLLALEAAYTSVETRSAELYPYVLGVRSLVLDKYDSLSKIANVHAPLLMLHGQLDPVIPLRHGQTLFAAANEPKQMVIYPEVHHADFSNAQIVTPLMDAVRKYKLI